MNIPITSVVLNSDGSWTFSWDPSSARYRVVLWGIQLADTDQTTYTWTGQGYDDFPPPLEVVAQSDQAVSEQFKPYIIIQWYGEPTAAEYEIRQLISGEWQGVKTLQETGLWVYTYRTVTLPDDTLQQYRVVAIDALGNESEPRLYRRYVICPPQPPDKQVGVVYAGGSVTVNLVS